MELDTLVKELNKKIISKGVGLEKLNNNDLTEVERDFVEKYKPEKAIIIYGSLAPNRPNHSKIEHINGKWLKGIVKGTLVNEGWGAKMGYYAFKHSHSDVPEIIDAYVLFSDKLVANWSYLDEFEGDGYKRLLAKFELETGEIGVGNIYALNDSGF
ncbi:gamma-glutamylcyclotransferase [Spirosoma sp. KNUC1025]|uniref:gamma-glutamylcyclotransferase n=1 Tax=Spirosoma sp. KNUC1025 TaxID=2894082 RepID=UPI0038684A1A|nr:gamma-glutamylcyclotransferase [Spirosoma sp. KNUC1025]